MLKNILTLGMMGALLTGCSQGGGSVRDYNSGYQPYKNNLLLDELRADAPDSIQKHTIDDGVLPKSVAGEEWGVPIRGKLLYEAYKSKNLERLKYESDAEYSARVGVVNDVFTIRGYVSIDYNPETKKISISEAAGEYALTSFGYRYMENGSLGRFYGVQAGYGDSEDLGYYQGSNAFGVTTEVSKSKASEYYVVLGKGDTSLYEPMLGLVGDCSASSSEIRQAEGGIYIEYLIRPVAPYTYSTNGRETPTLSNPVERDVFYGFVRAVPLAARVKLRNSNAVLDDCSVRFFDAREEREKQIRAIESKYMAR